MIAGISPTDVHCVSGCGGNDALGWAAVIVGALGLALALVGVHFARKAWHASQGSLEIARDEHEKFLAREAARADFDLTIKLLSFQHPAGVISPREGKLVLLFQLGIENTGDRAAGPTIFNFLVPSCVHDAFWTDARGKELPQEIAASDLLWASEGDSVAGSEYEAQYLNRTIGRVSLRGNMVMHVKVKVDSLSLTDDVFGVRFKAQADELPDAVEERIEEFSVTVNR